jgi:hypothetical protein
LPTFTCASPATTTGIFGADFVTAPLTLFAIVVVVVVDVVVVDPPDVVVFSVDDFRGTVVDVAVMRGTSA